MRRNVIDRYPRETVDFIPLLDVTVNDQVVTDAADIEVAVVPELDRPTAWSNAISDGGAIGFILNGPSLGRGVFAIYVRPTAGPIQPVIEVGHIRLT